MLSLLHFVALGLTTLAGLPLSDEPGTASKNDSLFELRLAETQPGEGLTEATIEGTSQKVYLHESTLVDESGISKVYLVQDPRSDPALGLDFTPEAAKKMAETTEMQRGKLIALVVSGKVLAAPKVMMPLSERAAISGLSEARIKEIVELLHQESPDA